jgi:hypothetical protein
MPAGRKTSLCFIGTTIEPTDRSMRQATNACVTDRQPHEWARRGTTFCFFFGKKRRRVVQFFWVMSGCPCYFVQREKKTLYSKTDDYLYWACMEYICNTN